MLKLCSFKSSKTRLNFAREYGGFLQSQSHISTNLRDLDKEAAEIHNPLSENIPACMALLYTVKTSTTEPEKTTQIKLTIN